MKTIVLPQELFDMLERGIRGPGAPEVEWPALAIVWNGKLRIIAEDEAPPEE